MKKSYFAVLAVIVAIVMLSKINAAEQTAPAIETPPELADYAVATFAGGCFWCTESDFEKLDGVIDAVSGFTGGVIDNPSYKMVTSGSTRHTEAVQVYYDDEKISYAALLHSFWRQIDPTDGGGQFVDRGPSYRPGIFYHNTEQQQQAEKSKQDLADSGRFSKPIAVEITQFSAFWPAEEYHQDFYKKSARHYKFYRYGSGRDQFLTKAWGDDLHKPYQAESMNAKDVADEQAAALSTGAAATVFQANFVKPESTKLKQQLNEMQYYVTQEDGTEPPFRNEFWDNKEAGIYVDVVSGEPLFSSTDKYKSGTGWPSFTQPIDKNYIVEDVDFKLIYPRTELRSKLADSHLGHVFKDGPAPTGLRYCINSASLAFVPKEELEAKGYAKYLALFDE